MKTTNNYILFDSPKSRIDLLPFTYTRAISEIRAGILTIKEKWEHFLNTKTSYLVEDYLSEKFLSVFSKTNIFINSTIIPSESLAEQVTKIKSGEVIFHKNTFIAAGYNAKDFTTVFNNNFDSFKKIEFTEDIDTIEFKWDIFQKNNKNITDDFEILTKNRKSQKLNESNKLIGKHKIFIEEGADIQCATLNTTEGPIYIGKNTVVMEGALIRGPFALCDHSHVKMGAKIYTGTTIGPHCKVGGEINNSIFFGFANKAHDGFLGNSVIGEWCNIGADSNNSNLKNNYDDVKVWDYNKKGFSSSGSQFCGLFMGDHSKCGINTMFNTGTVVGVSCNIYGAGFPRTFIPSFSWGGAAGTTIHKLNKAFKTAELVMKRRELEFDKIEKEIFEHIFELSQEFHH
ncbi:MAG: GlmU family protein [Bacteroidota bacterium]|nr:GlmU family protein [Bacteroidota bacterium]